MSTIGNLFSGSGLFFNALIDSYPWRLALNEDAQSLSPEKRSYLESKTQELAAKLQINKPITLIEIKDLPSITEPIGNRSFPGRIAIAIDPKHFDSMKEEHQEFVIARDLSSIQANNIIRIGVFAGLVGLITTIAISLLFPQLALFFSHPIYNLIGGMTSPAAGIGLLVSLFTSAYFSKWREECADKMGLSICSNSSKNKAHSFFEKMRLSQLQLRKSPDGSFLSKLWRKITITEEGENRFDLKYPSLKTRINYLKAESEAKTR